jgi:hypothetical protein
MIARTHPPSFESVEDILNLDWQLVPTPDDLDVAPVTQEKVKRRIWQR